MSELILVYFFGLDNAQLFLNMFYVTLLSLLLTVLTASFYDNGKRDRHPAVAS